MVNTEIRLIISFAAKNGEALYSQQKQDREVTVAQIIYSLMPNSDLKKVGKTTRPFRYELNQIPYDYTMAVRNRFKRLDMIDRVPDELWTEVHDLVQETGIKTMPSKKKCQHTSLKENLWMKAQHEGALTPACIVQKNPQVPQTFQVDCHPVNNSKGKRRSTSSTED